jgi:opacity protein-like surface antigen
MKTHHRLSTLAIAILAACMAHPAAAADKDSGFYFRVGIGPNWGLDPGIKISGASVNGDMDAGIRATLAFGYEFNRYLSAELETGYLWNTFEHFDGALGHIPAMVDGVFRYPIGKVFEPYVGAGLGASADLLHIHDFGINDTDTDLNFAWQALAGFRFKFTQQASILLGYRYFGTTGSAYNLDGEHVHLGSSNNHSINVAFAVRF